MSTSEKVVVVTGASQGIGAEVVKAFRKLDYRVVIKSPMNPPEYHETLGGFHPMGRMGEMSDIAGAILFLDSAPFITGEILHVDGGQSAGH
jgi:NAD(P)-dependent dehydrogenase (short-subunit alcohol dehydrogenase family)